MDARQGARIRGHFRGQGQGRGRVSGSSSVITAPTAVDGHTTRHDTQCRRKLSRCWVAAQARPTRSPGGDASRSPFSFVLGLRQNPEISRGRDWALPRPAKKLGLFDPIDLKGMRVRGLRLPSFQIMGGGGAEPRKGQIRLCCVVWWMGLFQTHSIPDSGPFLVSAFLASYRPAIGLTRPA